MNLSTILHCFVYVNLAVGQVSMNTLNIVYVKFLVSGTQSLSTLRVVVRGISPMWGGEIMPFHLSPCDKTSDTVFSTSLFTFNPSDTSAAWLPPWEWHNVHVSWQLIQISVFLQIEATWPIHGYAQSPDFTAATSSPP